MNMQRLKAAEEAFLLHYPGGFEHPEMVKIGKKHQMPQRVQQAQRSLRQKRSVSLS